MSRAVLPGAARPDPRATRCPLCDSGQVIPSAMRSDGYELARCRSCRFMWVPDAVPVSYDGYGEYLAAVDLDSELRSIDRHWGRRLRQLRAGSDGPLTLLDIGCGAGYFVHYCRRIGFDAQGYEPSSYLRTLAATQLGLDLLDDLAALRRSGAQFDVVCLFEVLEHVPPRELDTFLDQAAALLKPGGSLIGSTPNVDSLNVRVLGARDPVIWPPSHLSYFSVSSLDRFLGGRGMTRERLYTYGVAPFRWTKTTPSFVTAPRSAAARVVAAVLRAMLFAAGRVVRGSRLGYTIAFHFTLSGSARRAAGD